jgi:hypothetical protein
VPDAAETLDGFGASLATGELGAGVQADLAVGVAGEDIGAAADAGLVHVLYGSASGPAGTGSQAWQQNTPAIADVAESSDQFGAAVSIVDVVGKPRADLVVGVPGEDLEGTDVTDAGALAVLRSTTTGLTASGDLVVLQEAAHAEPGDGFGAVLS